MRAALSLLFLMTTLLPAAEAPIYLLWYDTEDHVEHTSDDAALHLATDLENMSVNARSRSSGRSSPARIARA